jgi:hypothetical protein
VFTAQVATTPTARELYLTDNRCDEDEECCEAVFEKQKQQLLFHVDHYYIIDFIRLIQAKWDAFIHKELDKETCVYPRDFYNIIHQGAAVLVQRC